ncbi:MAG TPA: hypothetical protein VJR29_06375 [bacterium]|nr:hypothetical protein [bacterium]
MAKKKSKRSPKKKSTQWWQWLAIAAGAFLLYQGIEHFLYPPKESGSKKSVSLKTKDRKKERAKDKEREKEKPAPSPVGAARPSPTPTPHASPTPPAATGGPVAKWDFSSAARFLPPEAYPDNYTALALEGSSGLLAYAKTIPGKKPGPQGLTNTQPGLRALLWNGKAYDAKELDFNAVKSELENFKLVGLPQPERRPWIGGAAKVYPMKLFFTDETRLAVAYAVVEPNGPRWATVIDSSGKASPAVFLQGTTAAVTRKVRREEKNGKFYIVSERGSLDLDAPEAGYRWKVEAYAWNGKDFVFDKELSAQLTKEKKAE